MAKIEQLKHSSNFELPPPENNSLGNPVEELKSKDYSALSLSLLQKGEFRLLHGDKGGVEYFDLASKLDPNNPQLFFEQGLSLFEYGSREESNEGLTLASKRFKMATSLDPYCFQAWHLWGNTLYFLGKRRNETSYFTNALKKYEKAIYFSDGQPPDVLADLYWDFGDVWGKLAEKSGEITDYHYAIKAYEKTSTLQDDLAPEFWINFGNVYMVMGKKTNDTHLLIKAINCYKNAVSISISLAEGWFLLGTSMKTLYSYSHDDDHFSQANECFSTTVQLSKNDSEVWLEWARLLLESGTIFKDSKKLSSSVDKCLKAHLCDKKNPFVIAVWAEALALLGCFSDRLDLIHEAQSKIEPLVNQIENTEVLYAYGIIFYALGSYYKDIDYYYQSLEKFQEGLSINRAHRLLWYAIASSSFAAALLDQDVKSYERSLHFFEQALNLRKTSTCHSHYAICLLKYGELNHEQATIEQSVCHFEEALNMQKNASYLHPDWLFYYASALDLLAGFQESDHLYAKALDLLNHILMMKPEFPYIHFQLALTYSHYGELVSEPEIFHRAIHHYRIAHQKEKENDQIILDWALTLVNFGELLEGEVESDQYFREAEYKMIQAAKLGNIHAYYALSCLYSVIGYLDNSLWFLEKAKAFDALPILDDIFEDDWLENLRETEGFQAFIELLESQKQE